MKKILISVIVVGVILGVFFFINKKEAIAPVVIDQNLTEKVNVENYLRENISKLSPVKAVLGGTWYVVSTTIDLEKKSGTVVYEDGHIQETKNFSYTTNQKGEILSLVIIDTTKIIACTQEAKQCPDGSYVGRTGPKCEFTECTTPQIKETNTASLNQKILTGGIFITPLQVVSDSRCPAYVQCVWAGEILIKVKLEKEGISKEIELKQGASVVFEKSNVSLVSVIPENKTKIPILPKDYKFTFKVVLIN